MKQGIDQLNLDDDPDMVYEAVSNTITDAVEKAIPLKSVKITCKRKGKPWITSELVNHIKERHALYGKYVRKPITFGQKYKEYRNKVNGML